MLDMEICALKPPLLCFPAFTYRLLSTVLIVLKLSNSWTTFTYLPNGNTTYYCYLLNIFLKIASVFYLHEYVHFIIVT